MIYIEINKIEQKSDHGEIRASVDRSFYGSDPLKELVPEELRHYVSNIKSFPHHYEIDNEGAFDAMHMGGYYLLSWEELKALTMRAFSDKIMEKVLDEATKK